MQSILITTEYQSRTSPLPRLHIHCDCGYDDTAGTLPSMARRLDEARRRAQIHNVRQHHGSHFIKVRA